MNGKGDKPRPVDRARYESHYDRIFRRNDMNTDTKWIDIPVPGGVERISRYAWDAIRADERAKIVAFLRVMGATWRVYYHQTQWDTVDAADAIERGDHEAPA